MQHSMYSTDDKVKHTNKLLLLIYKDQLHAELKDGPNYITEGWLLVIAHTQDCLDICHVAHSWFW